MDLKDLTLEHFAALLNQRFRVSGGAATIEVDLIEATGLGAGRKGRRDPFSLVFRGPQSPALIQRIYSVQGETVDALEIFLVPIGPDEDGTAALYQAIFA